MDLKSYLREVPGFPKPGINFIDITTLLKEPKALAEAIRQMVQPFEGRGIQKVVGMEARGFILGTPIAMHLEAGFVPVRKPGKLPAATHQVTYQLEYGEDTLCIHQDALESGEKVLIVDDLLATGGTVGATIDLIQKVGGDVVAACFLVDITALKNLPPRAALNGVETHVVVPV